MGHSYDGVERRKHLRYSKNYSLFFYITDSPDKKSDAAFIKDIGKGGIRFTNSQPIKTDTRLVFEIGISYIAPKKLILEGLVVSSKEITPRFVYEIRAKFNITDDATLKLLEMIEKRNLKDPKAYGLH